MKDKYIKHIHYYPQFLLKNWGRFTDKYSLTKKEFRVDKISIKQIASYKRQSKNQTNLWDEIERNWNDEYKYKGEELELHLSKTLGTFGKEPNEIINNIKNVKQKELELFMKMLIFKAPNIRNSKQFFSTIGTSDEGRRHEDSDLLVMSSLNSLESNNKEAFNRLKGKNFIIFATNYPLPFIDPGFNILNLNNELSFIAQISPHIVTISSTNEVLNSLKVLKKMTEAGKYEKVLEFLIGSNSLLKDIYFSNLTNEQIGEHAKNEMIKMIQDEYDKIDSKKIVGSVSMMTQPPLKYTAQVLIGKQLIQFAISFNKKDGLMKAFLDNKKFKYFFKDVVISNDIKSIKMVEMPGRIIRIDNNEMKIDS